jgi:signal transduction histidine kinase
MDSHETTIYIAVLITARVMGCIIIFFAFSMIRQQRKHNRLQRKYFSHQINLLEADRERVARDLHDEVGPSISMVKSHINEIITADKKSEMHIERANENLYKVTQRMGQIAVNLAPGALQKKGLHYVLQDFVEDAEAASGMEFQLKYEVMKDIPASMGIHLYRIVQEICHNAMKHSYASHITIHFKETGKKIYLYCKDDGTGFMEPQNGKGMGLGSLKSRTQILGGSMRYQSQFNKGTEYFFEFGLPKNQPI